MDTATFGAMNVDWEDRHDIPRLRTERLHRLKAELERSDLAAVLTFDFHNIRLPLRHFHYERFDTPDDEEDGKWSVNFQTSPQGEVDKAVMSLDEAEAAFTRRVPAALSAPETLRQYAGTYESPTGAKFEIKLKEGGDLVLAFPGAPLQSLVPWKPHRLRVKEFSDTFVEFVLVDGRVTAFKQSDPSGEFTFPRK